MPATNRGPLALAVGEHDGGEELLEDAGVLDDVPDVGAGLQRVARPLLLGGDEAVQSLGELLPAVLVAHPVRQRPQGPPDPPAAQPRETGALSVGTSRTAPGA